MTKVYPFFKKPSAPNIIEIGNNEVGTLQIQKLGCLTVNEATEMDSLLQKVISENENLPMSLLKVKVATLAFQNRVIFGEKIGDPDWTESDTIGAIDAKMGLIDAIHEFLFDGERNQWKNTKHLLKLEGADAETLANEYAEKGNLSVASKDGAWYVFKNDSDIPGDYDRTETKSVAKVGKGKS